VISRIGRVTRIRLLASVCLFTCVDLIPRIRLITSTRLIPRATRLANRRVSLGIDTSRPLGHVIR